MKQINKLLFVILIGVIAYLPAWAIDTAQVKPVKNVILMIPDGTSLATVSAARWYQWYLDPEKPNLAIDPYICGTVRTHSSNAPIGDSAPTTSCYMTGYPSLAGYVATYPVSKGTDDIYPMDSSRAYQPLVTLMEAAKITQQKAAGLVFTCEFPHATPADCAAHSYKRSRYDWIAPQMVHNQIDVVIGGGAGILSQEDETYLKNQAFTVYKNDLIGTRNDNNPKMWALFANNDMDFELDRNPDQEPSLQEMTQIALEKLSKNENGFFLMVEGSKVDWAAHANDPAAMITDFLAFDKACQTAIEFAQKNQNTAVVIVPDHGNSGFSIGVNHCKSYSSATKNELFYNISQVKLSASGIAQKLNEQHSDSVQSIFENYAGFQLDEEEINALYNCKEYRNSPIPEAERSDIQITPALYSNSLSGVVAKLITSKTCFGFTTNGHTGEDVFLAAYHPHGTIPTGMVTNVALNHYMTAALGLHGQLEKLTETLFVPHYEVFKNYKFEIIHDANDNNIPPTLVVKNKKKQLNIKPNTNIVTAGKKNTEIIQLNSVIVYVDVNQTFYLPQSLVNYLEK